VENNLFPSGCYCSALSGCSCPGGRLAQPPPPCLANGYVVETRPVPSPPPHVVLFTARFLPDLAFQNKGEMAMRWLLGLPGRRPGARRPTPALPAAAWGPRVGCRWDGAEPLLWGQVPVLQPNGPGTPLDAPQSPPWIDQLLWKAFYTASGLALAQAEG